MSWLRPLDGRTWMELPAKRLVNNQPPDAEKIARARELSKVYNRKKTAQIMGVSKATLWRWLK
jgi:DNA-binding transcriptional regulator YiaG